MTRTCGFLQENNDKFIDFQKYFQGYMFMGTLNPSNNKKITIIG